MIQYLTMQEQNKFLVPLAIIVAGGLISGAIYLGGGSKSKNSLTTNPDPARDEVEFTKITDDDHVLGDRDAELFIVEYSDTECPFCKVFHTTMKEIMNTYGEKVAWVYRHYPIEQLHSRALKEAEATECAADLGGNEGFWNYLDKLFATTPSNNSLDPLQLPKIAQSVGLDTARFNTCLSSGKYSEFIDKSIELASKAGARGTPYSLIVDRNNNIKEVINGAEPLANVKAKIDTLLK